MAQLNEEQAMLRDMADNWLRERLPITQCRRLYSGSLSKGYDPEIYAEMASMGWSGILVPEDFGGVDFGFLSLGLILEAQGKTLGPSPLLSSALIFASAFKIAGTLEQKQKYLPQIADGSLIGALALDEGPRHGPFEVATKAVKTSNGWQLDGFKRPVQDGMAADVFIVAARTSGVSGDAKGLTLFIVPVDAIGFNREALNQVDARFPAFLKLDGVQLDENAVLGAVDDGAQFLEQILDIARIGISAEMLGGASQAFDNILEYLKMRVQFGKKIGTFQALQHRAAFMFGELQMLRSAVEAALIALDEGNSQIPIFASMAKALAGEVFNLITNEMVQMHGGIGMTHEHDAGLYIKRARVADQFYGNIAFHRERWGRLNGY